MSYDIIPTVVFGVVAVFAIQGATIYSIARLLVTGRAVFERREHEPRIVSLHDRISER